MKRSEIGSSEGSKMVNESIEKGGFVFPLIKNYMI
jgi:hypothetical protein